MLKGIVSDILTVLLSTYNICFGQKEILLSDTLFFWMQAPEKECIIKKLFGYFLTKTYVMGT